MAKRVVVLLGQSNARGGAGSVAPGDLFDAYPACQYRHRNSPTGADDGTASTANEDLDNVGTTEDWGVELSLGRALVRHGIADPMILKVSSGGTSLAAHWRASVDGGGNPGVWHAHFRAQWTALLAANAGATPIAVVWMQGESDATQETWAADYEDRLVNLIAEIRSYVGVAALPFYITTMTADFAPTYRSDVDNAQVAIAAADNAAHLIDLGDQDDLGDNTHFDAASLARIGDRIANQYVLDYVGISGAVTL